jgi:hypothetical protein
MGDQTKSFGETATSLARNPLGIIALFIVLVYGFASLVTAFAGSFTAAERIPLIYFLIFFPVLVLGVFSWLVSKHSGKLFAPSDFKNEDNYVKMQMAVVASLTAATAKSDTPASEAELHKIVEVVRAAGTVPDATGDGWRNHFYGWMIGLITISTSAKPSKLWGSVSLWRCPLTKHLKSCQRQNTLRSSRTWVVARGHARATCYLTDCGKKVTVHLFSSTLPPMRQNIDARREIMAGKVAPTMHRNSSRWLLEPSLVDKRRRCG